MTIKTTIFWDITLFSPGYRNILLPSSGIKSEGVFSFEDGSSVLLRNVPNFNQIKRNHIPGDINFLRFNPKGLAFNILS
jgi:hypothetical protein